MNVISVGGQYRTGKDELSNYLAQTLNARGRTGEWQRIGFAFAVKKVFMDAFGVTWDFIEEWKVKDEIPPGFGMVMRKALQFIGDGFRKIKDNIWIETALRNNFNMIISDQRYINEIRAVRAKKGLTILIGRPGFENNDPNPSESQIKPTVDWFMNNHLEGDVRRLDLSEQVGDAFPGLVDIFIRNEGTLQDLYDKIESIIVPVVEEVYKHL